MKHVLLYQPVADALERAPAHFEAHTAKADEFHARGTLRMYGTFGDGVAQGSMAIFTTREDAERFVAEDPFVQHGVVASYEIREWDEQYV